MTELTFEPDEIRQQPLEPGSRAIPAWLAEFADHAGRAAARGEEVHVRFEREMLTTSEAAERLSVDKTTVWRMIKDGRLSAEKAGSHYRISAEEVRRHHEERMRRMTGDLAGEVLGELYRS